jgi:hypothetical protein
MNVVVAQKNDRPSPTPAPGSSLPFASPCPRNDCKARELSGAKAAVGRTTVIADGGYRGAGLVIPHRRKRGQAELPAWKEEHNTSHRKVRPASSTPSPPVVHPGPAQCDKQGVRALRQQHRQTAGDQAALAAALGVGGIRGGLQQVPDDEGRVVVVDVEGEHPGVQVAVVPEHVRVQEAQREARLIRVRVDNRGSACHSDRLRQSL